MLPENHLGYLNLGFKIKYHYLYTGISAEGICCAVDEPTLLSWQYLQNAQLTSPKQQLFCAPVGEAAPWESKSTTGIILYGVTWKE